MLANNLLHEVPEAGNVTVAAKQAGFEVVETRTVYSKPPRTLKMEIKNKLKFLAFSYVSNACVPL